MDKLPRILLAWEAGGARGHIASLEHIARSLADIAKCEAALCDLQNTSSIAAHCDLVFRAPGLRFGADAKDGVNLPPAATWGDYLGGIGFFDPERIKRQLQWWLTAIRTRQPDLLVANYAPCAMLAARISRTPAMVAGTGFGAPPQGLAAFPFLFDDRIVRRHDEDRLVENVNQAAGPLGLPKISAFPEIYQRAGDLVQSFDLLDLYAGQRSEPLIAPVQPLPLSNVDAREELFIYFSERELETDAVVAALIACPFPRRAFLPTASPEVKTRLAASGVMIETSPVPREEIARRSRLILCSGQHGMLSLALVAGIAVVAIPQHFEQRYHSRRAAPAGMCRPIDKKHATADNILGALMEAWTDHGVQAAARSQAQRLRPFVEQDAAQEIRNRVSAVLAGRFQHA